MALSFDAVWFAAVLAFGAAAAWIIAKGARPTARDYLRFAAALYATLAVSAILKLSPGAVAAIVATLGQASIALGVHASFRRPPRPGIAALALAGACIMGIGAAATGEIVLAVLPQLLCALVMLAISRRGLKRLRAPSIQLAAGAAALMAASCSLVSEDQNAFMALLLFSAAGILGTSLAVARISDTFVKRRRKTQSASAIDRPR